MSMKRFSLLASAMLAPALAPGAQWADLEGRIQYGFYVEDARSLRALAETPASRDEPLSGYYAALASYRLALVAVERDKGTARAAVEACADRLHPVVKSQPELAEALALQSACLGMLTGLKPWKAAVTAPRSTSLLERAVKLAPKNPRVRLLEALADYERPKMFGGDRERAYVKLQRAVELFEAERGEAQQFPGWGAAEAYAYLARSHLDHANAVAARGALERALLIAPDFALAKRLLARITSS
jgi:hypothetical protein